MTRPQPSVGRFLGRLSWKPGRQVPLSSGARLALAVASLLSALLWAWAALVLPWRSTGAWTWLMGALALAHAALAASALAWPRGLARIWRAAGAFSVTAGVYSLVAIAWAGASVVQSHGALGWGISALLAVIALLVLAASVPLGAWGLWCTRARDEQR